MILYYRLLGECNAPPANKKPTNVGLDGVKFIALSGGYFTFSKSQLYTSTI